MKKSQKTLLIWMIVLVSIVAVVGASWFGIKQMTGLNEQYGVPTFGFLKCLPTSQISKNVIFGSELVTVRCDKDSKGNTLLGTNDGCVVRLTAPDKTALFKRIYAYRIIDEFGATSQQVIPGGTLGYKGEFVTINLKRTDSLQVGYGGALFGDLKSEGQSYAVSGSPFAIYNVNDFSSLNGQIFPNTRVGNCYLEDSNLKGSQINYKSPEIKGLNDVSLDFKNLNKPYGVYTYFKGLVTVPEIDLKFQTLNGEKVYCMDNALYKILKITTTSGNTYNIVNYEKSGYIQSVTCCEGDESKPGYVCQNNAWIKIETAECDLSVGKFCPQSAFQPFGELQYKRLACVDKKCVPEIINVKCNDDSDCKGGEVCVIQTNPEKNKCVEGGSGTVPKPPQPVVVTPCKPIYSILGMTIIPNPTCFSWWGQVQLVSSVLITLFAFVLTFTWLKQKFSGKDERVMLWVLSLAITVIFGILAWLVFWVGVVMFIIYLIIRILVAVFLKR